MKISIITPVKNNVRYIEECIQSVLRQATHEHIFVDGVSTDGTLSIIQKYQKEYPDRIRYISGPDKSAGEAWVKGMRLAHGDVLGWLGADDTLTPDALRVVSDYFYYFQRLLFPQRALQRAFIYGGVNYINASGKLIKTPKLRDFNYREAVNDYCAIPCTSAFYRREVVEKVPPDVIARNDGELEWWLQIGRKYELHRIPFVLSNFRVYPDKQRANSFYKYARTVYGINRKYGAGRLSKCALRYYASVVSRPFSPILTPVFKWLTYKSSRQEFTERK